jgi:large subunit ribosomal protein L21
MFAICSIQGKQYTLQKGESVLVDHINAKVGSDLTIDTVLSLVNGKAIQMGKPYLADTQVQARVENHIKAKKIVVFHRRKRKDSRKKQGHRQVYTQLKIMDIVQLSG